MFCVGMVLGIYLYHSITKKDVFIEHPALIVFVVIAFLLDIRHWIPKLTRRKTE